MSKVLITGAGGYVGGRLARRMAAAGWAVSGLVRDPAPGLDVPQITCDLAADEPAGLEEAVAGAQAVVHLAGENELIAARRPAAALAATVVAAERVAEACAEAGVQRLVYLSTVHVYGERMIPGALLTEDLRPEPRSAYAISRLASEHVVAAMGHGAYELAVLRLTNSVGAPADPGVDRWSLVANDLCRQGAVTGSLALRSSGVQWRDFVDLGQVCGAITAAAEPGGAVAPGTYNLGSGRPSTVRALAELVADAFALQTGRRPELTAPDPEPDPPGPYSVSVEKAARHGMRLDGPLRDAVQETVGFCLAHREELA